MCGCMTILYVKLPFGRIECQFEVNDYWRDTGVSSRTIVSLGPNHGMNVYIMACGRNISQRKHETKAT